MKRVLLVTLLLITTLSISALAIPVSASSENAASKVFQVTTSDRYDRNPSLFKAADGTYWLFFTRGRNPIGIRGVDYDPDSDSYDVYYKTARSIPGLKIAAEQLLPGSNFVTDNAQRDVTTFQASDGKIWVFTSSGYAPSTDPYVLYYTYDGAAWSGPTQIPGTWDAGHINALEYDGKIWVFFDAWAYILQVTYWDEDVSSWSSPALISQKASIAKAIVDRGIFYVVWSYVDMDLNEYGKYIGLSTSTDGITWTNHGEIASWQGGTNWDPVLTKDNKAFRLFWAPDAGVEGQFIATSMATNPTDPDSWSAPVKLTIANYDTGSWWDFWPQPYYDGLTYLAYTSERNSSGTSMSDGNIWLMHVTVPLTR